MTAENEQGQDLVAKSLSRRSAILPCSESAYRVQQFAHQISAEYIFTARELLHFAVLADHRRHSTEYAGLTLLPRP